MILLFDRDLSLLSLYVIPLMEAGASSFLRRVVVWLLPEILEVILLVEKMEVLVAEITTQC